MITIKYVKLLLSPNTQGNMKSCDFSINETSQTSQSFIDSGQKCSAGEVASLYVRQHTGHPPTSFGRIRVPNAKPLKSQTLKQNQVKYYIGLI